MRVCPDARIQKVSQSPQQMDHWYITAWMRSTVVQIFDMLVLGPLYFMLGRVESILDIANSQDDPSVIKVVCSGDNFRFISKESFCACSLIKTGELAAVPLVTERALDVFIQVATSGPSYSEDLLDIEVRYYDI